jgi:hypothetical protein
MARKNEKIARRARIACEKWRENFKYNIDLYHTMHTFVLGQQWTDDEEDEMIKTFRKVPLQANHLSAMSNSMSGEQQQNTPQLQVVPMTNCDDETAKLRELIVKDIVFSTPATTTYQVSGQQAFIGGYSAFCVDTEYTHSKSFELDITHRYFKDATRTYFDLGAETINKTDGLHSGYITRLTRPKFRQVYGKELEEKISKTMSPSQTQEEIALAVQPSDGDDPFTWADNDAITIIDHFERKYEKDTLYKLSNGNILNQEEMDELIEKSSGMDTPDMYGNVMNEENSEIMQGEDQEEGQEIAPANLDPEFMTLFQDGQPVRIVDKRDSKRYKIVHYKIAGDYILEESEFPSEQLPLIFVDQNSYYDKDGKQICRSFFGDCKDTQRYINYLRTQSAYILKVSRYDQWIGSKKNVQGLDTQRNWKDPNNTQGMLTYDESPSGAKPEQVHPPELSVSLFQQYELAVEDLYRTTGLYPTRMGNEGNEVSGKAIDARTRQGSYATYVAFNSINRAIATGGEIVNEMIPRVYDSERVIALMTPDEGMKNITINKQADEYGELIENDIRKGTYQVRLKPGPSYEGQKQEALMSLQQVLQADPRTFELIADLYAENLPLMNTIEIKNRLKTMVPKQILEAGKTGKMPYETGGDAPTPEQQEMALQQQQMQMQTQFKQQELQLKQQELELKKQEIMMEAQFRIQELETERLQAATELQEQELRYMSESDRTRSNEQIAQADNLMKLLTHKMSMNKEKNNNGDRNK